jgi:mRNA-degrading endonuclease RelE of RelBE toxin-antitoxin system
MLAYSVDVHLDLIEAVPAKGDQRRLIMRFIRSLADNPDTSGDFTNQDTSLRMRQIKVIGRYAITYWVDDPVKVVMVVGVQPADGGKSKTNSIEALSI